MDEKLASHLISEYEKGCKEYGIEILDVKYGARKVTLFVEVDGEKKEYTSSISGNEVLNSHVAVLRQVYWEKRDPPKPKPKKVEQTKEDNPMKGTLTYKDIYKQ